MKLFKIESTIETDDDWCPDKIRKMIDFCFNRGDGAYIEVGRKMKLKLLKSEPDEPDEDHSIND